MSRPAMRSLWRHNLACGVIARRLASCGFFDRETAYTAGILHDIGRIALAVIQPKEYAALLDTHRGPAESILDRERDMFGWNHCETGQSLIREWKLPPDFAAVVQDHHSARRTDGAWDLAELAKVSCSMAAATGFPAFAGCESDPYPDLLDQLPARERRLFCPLLEDLAEEVTSSIQAIEVA